MAALAVTDRYPDGPAPEETFTLLLCGDVMTGRGIDQILPHPADPRLFEPYVNSARHYVELAEEANGPIPQPVEFSYIWGDACAEFQRIRPDARIINLETSITDSTDPMPKGINYKMSQRNIPCITAAAIDCCVLANNHALDWKRGGLADTLDALAHAHIATTGAGPTAEVASRPAIVELDMKGRVVVFAFGSPTSGIPEAWAAGSDRAGVNFLRNFSQQAATEIGEKVRTIKRPRDVVVASIHWGGNWGYSVPVEHVQFAHALIDTASVDIVHGHSSHHAKAIEVYKERLILYGCGDFMNDYEGVQGLEEFRDDLAIAYFPTVAAESGALRRLDMTPFRIKKFRLNAASEEDLSWLERTLSREGRRFGTRVESAKRRLTLVGF